MNGTPKVSVGVITYNHEKYVARMLDSLLSQQTDFEYEIIVGDDLSKDNTRAILREYQQRYPEQIRLLLHDKNLGNNGRFNALKVFAAARGEYIAQFDGDDYVTSPHKLQRQADLLDAHPEYPACFHNATVVYEDNAVPPALLNVDYRKPEITVEDLIGEDEVFFIATSSLMLRRDQFEAFPEPAWVDRSSSGDIPRNILIAARGPIGYLDESMVVYWKNRGGSSFRDIYHDAKFLRNRIQMYRDIDRELKYRYHDRLRRNIARYYRMLPEATQYARRPGARARLALKSLWLSRPNPPDRVRETLLQYVIPRTIQKLYSRTKWGMERMIGKA